MMPLTRLYGFHSVVCMQPAVKTLIRGDVDLGSITVCHATYISFPVRFFIIIRTSPATVVITDLSTLWLRTAV